jgi:hypothetical protein
MTAKSNEIITKLKQLGVPDNKIKSSSNNYGGFSPIDVPNGTSYTLYLTITAESKALAQKVQDYLLTTSPSGAVTPSGNLSTAKQKQLQDQARDKAEQDARAKANQSAKNLGFKVKQVKSVEDGSLNGGLCNFNICPLSQTDINSSLSPGMNAQSNQLSLQPGENDLDYSVKVTYYIK